MTIVGGDFLWLLLEPDNSDNGMDRIIRGTNGGVGTQLAIGCAPFHLLRENWHRIDVYRFPNGVIQVFMDGESTPRIEAIDASLSGSGGIALRAVAPGVRFDNVSFDIALPPDPPPPSASSCPSWNGLDESCAVEVSTLAPTPVLSRMGFALMTLAILGGGIWFLRARNG